MPSREFPLSWDQHKAIIDTIKANGQLPFAAQSAGISLGRLRDLMKRYEDFAEEISEALEVFKSALFLTALERATVGKSDTMLVKVLEAKLEDFSSDGRKAAMATNNRISGVRLRTFDSDGNESGATDIQPSKPARPLQLELHRGL